jgi:galactose mutarotase-like enzyme
MTQHGFARDCEFEIIEQSEASVLLRLKSDENSKKHYPFEFNFDVHYSIKEAEIEVKYLVHNRGEGILPYSVGGHPGFSIKGDLKDYSLDFGKKISTNQWLLDGPYYSGKTNPLIIENELNLDYQLFENDAIVIRKPEFNQVILSHKEKGKIVGLSSETMDAIGFWTKENAPFLCIEPWWGWADSQDSNGNIVDKDRIHILNKNESKTHSYKIQLF